MVSTFAPFPTMEHSNKAIKIIFFIRSCNLNKILDKVAGINTDFRTLSFLL
jgi:hypothetical protein